MALKNSENNYLKISSIRLDIFDNSEIRIGCELWLDESKRTNPSEFDRPIKIMIRVSNFLDIVPDTDEDLKNYVIIMCYNKIKETVYHDRTHDFDFSTWTDC